MPNVLTNHPHAVDALYRAEKQKNFAGQKSGLAWDAKNQELALKTSDYETSGELRVYRGKFESEPIEGKFPFHEVVPSWNIRLNEESQGYRIEVRVAAEDKKWSPWFYFGSAGVMANDKAYKRTRRSPEWGMVDVDYLLLKKPAKYFQYRVQLEARGKRQPAGKNRLALQRFFVSYSNTSGDEALYKKYGPGKVAGSNWATTVSVPYRSQRWVPNVRLRGQICCPTCISMVLEAYGVNKPTMEVCRDALCAEEQIYGVWPRASQAAAKNGMVAWVDRFRSHDDVKRMIQKKIPVVASIRAGKNELPSSEYKSTNGHLILIRGFTPDGDYIVNDPYSQGPEGAESVYGKDEITKVWLDKGGVGVVIHPPDHPGANGKN
jgi:hypothetical protein